MSGRLRGEGVMACYENRSVNGGNVWKVSGHDNVWFKFAFRLQVRCLEGINECSTHHPRIVKRKR